MGYHTDFSGHFTLDKPMTHEHAAYLKAFNQTRRMKRDPEKTALLPDPIREAVGLPLGVDAGYFVGGAGFMGQDDSPDIVNYNRSPDDQPGLWCKWTPSEDSTRIEWDQNEKFYDYVEWLEYIIEHFLKPWGYTLNGKVYFYGEDSSDTGRINVDFNNVTLDYDVSGGLGLYADED